MGGGGAQANILLTNFVVYQKNTMNKKKKRQKFINKNLWNYGTYTLTAILHTHVMT